MQLAACGGDCKDETDAAQQFLTTTANLSCTTDADCEVVSTGCGHPARSACGQALLNHAAAQSGRWQQIQSDLTDCESSCAQCALAVIPHCTSGLCGGPP